MKSLPGKVGLTLLIGLGGALLAHYAALPADALIGSTLAVSCAALFRWVQTIPAGLRNLGFTVIGCTLASSFTRDIVHQAAHWPVSLLLQLVAVAAIVGIGSWVLVVFFQQSADTAVLATSPGALSFSLALAASGMGVMRSIVVVQSIRLLLVTTLLPFLLHHLHLGMGSQQVVVTMGIPAFFLVLAVSCGVGWLLTRIGIPAAYLLAGMVVSGAVHFSGLAVGRPAGMVIFLGFTITGTVVGSRIAAIPLADLKRLGGASVVVLLISGIITALFALVASKLLCIPFGQVFVAYAPGGVEAMAAIAFSLGYDPAFVAVHHLCRIIALIAVLPLAAKFLHRGIGNSPGSVQGKGAD